MKKYIYILIIISAFFISINDICAQSLAFSFGQQPLCWTSGSTTQTLSVTSSPPGTATYSWNTTSGTTCTNNASGATTTVNLGTCCGVYSVTCSAYNSSNVFISSVTQTMNITCPTWLNITVSPNNGIMCTGNTGTFVASGAVGYTWSSGSNSNSIIVSPSVSTCYSLSAVNASGCMIATTACFSVFPTPTVSLSPPITICAGQIATLSCWGGAISYTWIPGGFQGANPVVSPFSTTIYTVIASNGSCATTGTTAVAVNPNPSVAVNSNTNNACQGASVVLSATGANTYTWSTSATTSSVTVNPIMYTCYSVTGQSSQNCIGTTVICLSVQATNMLISPTSQTVCKGSSASFTASGASSYTWNTTPTLNTSAINIIPNSSTSYSASGTGTNGCIGISAAYVFVDSTCVNVWPGDANSDGTVNNLDVLELGLSFSATGTARSPGGNSFTSQFATAWIGNGSTGKNKAHIDCNGDGTVNNSDTFAIFNNYLLTHSFRPSNTSSTNSDISLVVQPNVFEGTWNKADIMLGTSISPINQLYGTAFEINYDNAMIETNSVYIIYTGSFLNAANQNVQFSKTYFNNGKLYAASVRVDGSNVSGDGKIGEFWFKPKTGLAANSVINLSTSNSSKIGNSGVNTLLTDGTAATTILANIVGLTKNSLHTSVRCFPNPTSNKLTIQSDVNATINYVVFDIVGRELIKGEFNNVANVDLSSYTNGTYIIRLESGSATTYKKLVIEK
ncbi:T9SS type A sorting domain-containing protein [Aurantibacillus circumpalustris]|uniref:T9SS type A sorting domain-containing protein n=1 Tax=Aurantibacillus circumpalustris TaxID=3036359 RepID=UPI00295ABB8B|nr:T9SS type A sorting domain-containing protein [Aurantibacillus circumpalustris]